MIYVLGGGGFVGSGFTRYCGLHGLDHRVITRDNYRDFSGTSCDVLIDASGNSRKYLADRDPIADFDRSVRLVALSLQSFTAGVYVLISSGDVYDDPSRPQSTSEARALDISRMSRYGQHKFLAEQLATGRHANWLIVRAGGFVGPGVKKNAVFDILTGTRIWLSPASALQFIHTDCAAAIVFGMVAAGVRRQIVNLGGRGVVRLGDLHAETGATGAFDAAAPTITYELSLEKLTALSPVDIPRSQDMVRRFAAQWPSSGAA